MSKADKNRSTLEQNGVKPNPNGSPDPRDHKAMMAAVPAAPDDPNTILSESILNMFINNEYSSLYDLLNDDLKSKTDPSALDGAFAKTEEAMGKYQSHNPWEIRYFRGSKAYTTLMKHEKGELGMVIIYDDNGKALGMSFLPAQVVKSMPGHI